MIKGLLGPEVSFVDMLHHSLVEKATKDEQKIKDGKSTKGPFRPSSAGSCERELSYKAMEHTGQAYYEKQAPEPHVQLIFAMGHAIEAMLIKCFEHVEFFETKYLQQVLTFFPIESGHKGIDWLLEGSNDGCFVAKVGDYKGVFDVKSKAVGVGSYQKTKWQEQDDKFYNMRTIQKISETGWWIEDPIAFIKELNDPFLAMNIWQLNLYCLSDFMKQRGFDFGSLIYFGKDDSRMREIRFKPSQKLYDLVEVRFQSAAKAAAQGKPHLAKQEFVLGSTKCAYCPYVKACWGVSDTTAKQEFYKTLPKKEWPENLDRNAPDIAEAVQMHHKLTQADAPKKRYENEIMQYMLEHNLDKVQTKVDNENIVYEIRKSKTTTSIKRSKA